MRYRMLWEAVRTTWRSADSHRPTAEQELAEHVNHVLINRYGHSPAGEVDERQVEHGVSVIVDGGAVPGIRIDTDRHVFAIGADLGRRGVVTAVLDRDELPYLVLEFATRALDG